MGWCGNSVVIVALFLLLAAPVAAEISYFFDVAENGETAVTIELTEPAAIAVPADVAVPEVEGGSFVREGKNLIIEPDGAATVTYASSLFTRKQEGVWHFENNIPSADSVVVVLPQAVHVVQAIPKAVFEKADRWQLSWENINGSISVSYVRVAQAEAARRALTVPLPDYSSRNMGFLLFLLIAGIAFYFCRRQSREVVKEVKKLVKEMPPNISEAQMNVIRAANPNEALVLKLLLKHNGHVKRNLLERDSGLSKSSLASSLKNLEKKNIITIDRTFFVHYITLSQWFRDLK